MKTIKKASLLFASLALVLGAGLVGNSDTKEVKADDKTTNTIEKSSSELATENNWSASSGDSIGTKFDSFNLDKNIVVSFTGAGNTATYWSASSGSDSSDIRIYGTRNKTDASISFTGVQGVEIKTITLEFTVKNSPTITPNIKTGTSFTVNSNSQTFDITSGKSNNAQVKITKFACTYSFTSQVTSVTLTPTKDITLAVGQSQTFIVGIEGTNLTGDEKATFSFAADGDNGDSLKLDKTSAKNDETVTVTAVEANKINKLIATCEDVTSAPITIMTENAKVLNEIEIQGSLTKSTYKVGDEFDPSGLTVFANYESGEQIDVTKHVEWSPLVITKDTTSITASYTENEKTVTASVTISVKTLSKITVDTNPVLTYEAGDKLDLSKMVVTKHYNDNSIETCTDYTTKPANGDALTSENKTLTISYPGVDDVVLDLNVTPIDFKEYQLVTSDTGDLSGTYLIVYQVSDTVGKSFDGRDASGDYYNVALNDNKLTHENKEVDKHTITLEKMAEGYSIKVNGGDNAGKYITGTSSSNKLNFVDTPDSAITISFTDKGDALITSNTSVFRFNKNSGSSNDRFRFYKAESYEAQQAVYLYRQLSVADKFVNDWNSTIRTNEKGLCDFLSGANKATLEALIARYDALEDANKAELVDKAGVKISESITYAQNVWNIQTTEGNYGNSGVVITSTNSFDKTSLIALFAILGIVTISGYYIIEKKKLSK